jgi:hypothetical protein
MPACVGVRSALVRINEELLEGKVATLVQKTEINDRGGSAALTTRHPSIHKSWHQISPTSGSCSVGIVHLRTKGHGVCFVFASMCRPFMLICWESEIYGLFHAWDILLYIWVCLLYHTWWTGLKTAKINQKALYFEKSW